MMFAQIMASMVAVAPNIFGKELSASVADKERPCHPKSLKGDIPSSQDTPDLW